MVLIFQKKKLKYAIYFYFRLNDTADGKESRLVMRANGSLRVILNTKLFAGMSIERPSEKNVRLTGYDEGQVKVFLITGGQKDIAQLSDKLLNRRPAQEAPKEEAAAKGESPAKSQDSQNEDGQSEPKKAKEVEPAQEDAST